MGYFHRVVEINGYKFGFEFYNRGSEDGSIHIDLAHFASNCAAFHEAVTIAGKISLDVSTLGFYLTANEYGDRIIRRKDRLDTEIQIDLINNLLNNSYLQLTSGESEILASFLSRLHANLPAPKNVQAEGYVYLLQSPTGWYKIGKTSDPNDRIKTFGVKLPFEVEYLALIKAQRMAKLEKELHAQYADKRGNGEWFRLDPEDVDYIKSLAVQS